MSGGETLAPRTRSLTAAERRLLACKAQALRSSASASPSRVLRVAAAGTGILWLLTLLATDDPWLVVTLFWLVVGGGIALWVWRDARKDAGYVRAMAAALESALERDRAEVYDITARAWAELGEVEDEGACYAFDLGDGRLVFVTGQAFYPAARFPSLDFSIVHPLDAEGRVADLWIEKRGERKAPDRVIPREVKWTLEIPEHLTVVRGSLEGLEDALARRDDA